jgi:hypothetical protein
VRLEKALPARRRRKRERGKKLNHEDLKDREENAMRNCRHVFLGGLRGLSGNFISYTGEVTGEPAKKKYGSLNVEPVHRVVVWITRKRKTSTVSSIRSLNASESIEPCPDGAAILALDNTLCRRKGAGYE